jgi:hypothetical protein
MFVGNRERGFPLKVFAISKETDSLQEAQKVYSLSDRELLRQNWNIRLGSIWDPSYLAIPANFVFYFAISYGLIFLFGKIKGRNNK